MKLRLNLTLGALLLAVLFAFGSVNFAHASALKTSAHNQALKPASEVIEILHGDGTSSYRTVPFKTTYTDVRFLVNGTNKDVKYIVGYFLWVIPIYSFDFPPGKYYSPPNNTVYGAVYS